MNKNDFIVVLKEKLKFLPYGEVEKITDYYYEYISDASESGKSEEEIIAELGDIDVLIYKLKAEQSFEAVKNKPTLSNGAKALIATVVGLFAVPIAFPVLISVFSVIVALFVTMVALGISLIAVLIACIVIVITLFVQSFALFPGNTGMTFLMLGGSLLASGTIWLLLLGFISLTRVIVIGLTKLTKSIFNWATKKRRV